MKNGHLPSHMAWMTYELQFWPGIWYVIGTMTNNIYEHVDVHWVEYFSGINSPCLNGLTYVTTVQLSLQLINALELALTKRADNYFHDEKMQYFLQEERR